MFSVTQLVGSRSRIGGTPASPMSILPDSPSPWEPSLVPAKMGAGCALVGQKALEEKMVLPHPPIQASVSSQALKTGTPAPLICGTADATVPQMLPDGSQTRRPPSPGSPILQALWVDRPHPSHPVATVFSRQPLAYVQCNYLSALLALG